MDPLQPSDSLIRPIELLKDAFVLYRAKFGIFLPICSLAFLGGVLQVFTFHSNVFIIALASLLNFVVSYLSYIATMYAAAEEDVPPHSFLDFYTQAWKVFVPYILVVLLTALVIAGGSVLFLIPGLILGIYIFCATFVVVFDGKRNLSALIQSYLYVKGRWWKVLSRILFLLLVIVLISGFLSIAFSNSNASVSVYNDSINAAINSFLIMPLGVTYFYVLFQSLKKRQMEVIPESTERRMKNQFIAFLVVGSVAIIFLTIVSSHLGSIHF